MRIITGTARNTPLQTIEGDATRPTSERVKEAVFSMLQFEVEGRRILDLFAGSGQMGLEALSRGAEHATFIDQSRECTDIIIENARRAKLFDRCRVSAVDYMSALRGNAGREKYDIIFIDPPYAEHLVARSLELITAGEMLNVGAVCVCETPCSPAGKKGRKKNEDPSAEIFENVFDKKAELRDKFIVRKSNAYGISRITLLEIAESEN